MSESEKSQTSGWGGVTRKWLAILLALSFAGVARADIIQTDPSLSSGGTPITGGTDKEICFNDGGSISCGDTGFVYDKTAKTVGINEVSPQAEFHLTNDQAALTEMRIDNTNASGSMALKLFDGSNERAQFEYDTAGALLTIGTNITSGQVAIDSAAGTEAVRIDASGNVTVQTGQLLVPDGSVSAPFIAPASTPGFGFRKFSDGVLTLVDAGADQIRFQKSGIFPVTDNTGDLGSTSLRWKHIRSGTELGIHDTSNFTTSLTTRGINNRPQSSTCADSGDSNPATLTLTPTSSYIEITNNDANGCTVTMGEGSAVVGDKTEIVVISNAGGTVDFSDTAAVSELSGAFNAAVNDVIAMRYKTAGDAASTGWVERFRSNN